MTAIFLPFFAYAALVLFVLYLAAKVCDWLDDDAPEHGPHAELHCLDDPEPWDEHPAVRADIAKTRTQKNEARMRAAGDRPWWEAS